MTDTRKLLEHCAKVMGGLLYVEDYDGWIHVDAEGNRGAWWNPFTSLADAADMAIKCKVDVMWKADHGEGITGVEAWVWNPDGIRVIAELKDHPTEQEAYCYAVVNVVAQVGGE